MKTWYMNLTTKQFRTITGLMLILPFYTNFMLSILEIKNPYKDYILGIVLLAFILIKIRRSTHPSEFPKVKWSASLIIAAVILLLYFGSILVSKF